MKKFGRDTIECIVERSITEFMNDGADPDSVVFFWKGYFVEALFEWCPSRFAFYLSKFTVVYTRCVMSYNVDEDFDRSIAWCE